MSGEAIIDHSSINTRAIENFNMKQKPTTIGLNNRSMNNPNLMNGSDLFANLNFDEKILNAQNYNGPVLSSILKNNLSGGFNFKQSEINSKSGSFLKKVEKKLEK
jgi:hypothetical protein